MTTTAPVSPYSLAQVVTDGPLTAPRWIHHLVKVATAAAIAAGLHLVFFSWLLATILGGPGVWVLLVLRERLWPTDPEPLTTWQHVADWMTDCSLATVPLVIVIVSRDRIGGGLLAGALVAAYLAGHRDARP